MRIGFYIHPTPLEDLDKSMAMAPKAAKHPEHGEGHWITVRGHHLFVPIKSGAPSREIADASDKSKSGHLVGKKLSANDHHRLLINTGHAPRAALRTPEEKLAGDKTKLARVRVLHKALPKVWASVEAGLALSDHDRKRVEAAVLALMLKANLRVGNEESAEYGVQGASSLTKDSVSVKGDTVRLTFTGKSGVPWDREIHDAKLARAMKYYCDTAKAGEPIFQVRNTDGSLKKLSDADVRAATRPMGFLPKDVRTYAASNTAFHALKKLSAKPGEVLTKKEIAARLKEALEITASTGGHSWTMARDNYVAPAILQDFISNGGRLTLPKPKYEVAKSRSEL